MLPFIERLRKFQDLVAMMNKKNYWQQKWQANDIKFHRLGVNEHLVKYCANLQLRPNDHVFVPLCGKGLDMLWLAERGYRITGVEISWKLIDSSQPILK